MRAIVDAGDLYRALRDTAKGQGKARLPILSHVLLTVEGGQLAVTRCDLETWADRYMPAMGAVDGATTVPARLLKDLAQCWANAGPLLLETLTQEPLPFTHRWSGPGTPRNELRPVEHSLLVKVNRFGFTAHIVAKDSAEFPPKPLPVEVAA